MDRAKVAVVVFAFLAIAAVIVAIVYFTQEIRTPNGITFSGPEHFGIVRDLRITEASGVSTSRRHRDVLYTFNDSGGTNDVFVLKISTGETLATYTITGATNIDWEGIAVGSCRDNKQCIFVGDIGSKGGNASRTIYRILEPDEIVDQDVALDAVLVYYWPDEVNAETLMVDPAGEIYLVTKVKKGKIPKILKFPMSAWHDNWTEIPRDIETSSIAEVPINSTHKDPVGGDISADGREVLLKMQSTMYYWEVTDRDYVSALATAPTEVTYEKEKQGEAVGWASDGSGYYTLSEGVNQTIYFYRRQ